MSTLHRRLLVLERTDSQAPGLLPIVLPDSTSDAEIEHHRAAGFEAYRFTDSVELFI